MRVSSDEGSDEEALGRLSETGSRFGTGSVDEARMPEECRVHDGSIPCDDVRHQLSRARTEAEAMAREARVEKQAGQSVNLRDHGYRVGRDVDQARPFLSDSGLGECRK